MNFNIILYLCMQILVVFCWGLPMKYKTSLNFYFGSGISSYSSYLIKIHKIELNKTLQGQAAAFVVM